MSISDRIKQKANDIRTKIYGQEVRESLASGLEEMSTEVEDTIGRQDHVETQFQQVVDKAYDADKKADSAISTSKNAKGIAETAANKAESVQTQFNQVVIDGDSSVEAAQARVDTKGNAFPTLKARLDKENQQVTSHLAQTGTHISQFPRYDDETTDSPRIIRAINHAYDNAITNIHFNAETYLISDIIHLKDNISLNGVSGTIFKIDDEYNKFHSVLSIKSVENIIIRGITFDGNIDRETYDLSKRPEIPVYIVDSKNVKIVDNIFHSNSVWTITCEVSEEFPYNDNIYIERNIIYAKLGKNSNPVEPNGFSLDTTQMYIDAKNYWVRDNIITTDQIHMQTAIEAHRNTGVVEGNIISGFNGGVLIVPGHFVEENEKTNIIIKDNKMSEVCTGVTLWQIPHRDIDDVIIQGNQIELNPNRFIKPEISLGVTALFTYAGNNNGKKIKNVLIDSNSISFKPFFDLYNDSDYVANFVGISMRGWVSMDNISITNNHILNAPGTGILVGVYSNSEFFNEAKGFFVSGNTIVDAGMNINIATTSFNPRSAIRVNGADGSHVKKSVIRDNMIVDTRVEGTYFTNPIRTAGVDDLTVYIEENKILANGYEKQEEEKEKTYTPEWRWDNMIGKPSLKSEGSYFENDGVTKVFGNIEITDMDNFTQGFGSIITLPTIARKTLYLPIVVVNHGYDSKLDSFVLKVNEGMDNAHVMYIDDDGSLSAVTRTRVKKGTIVSFNIEYLS